MNNLIIVAGFGPVGKAVVEVLGTNYSIEVVDIRFPDLCYKDINTALYDLTEMYFSNIIGIVCCTENVEEILKAARQYKLPVLPKFDVEMGDIINELARADFKVKNYE